MNRRAALALGGAIFVAVTVLDWVTKILSEEHLRRGPITLVDGWAWLRLAYNTGVAFSAFEGVPHWVLGIGAVVLLFAVVWSLRDLLERPAGVVAISLVAAGGINNAIDRLLDGRVTDMISVWRWPVFNVADSAITVGVILLLIIGRKKKKGQEAAQGSEPASAGSSS